MEVARVFLRLGATTFGGPSAHIAAMEDECVRRRGWIAHGAFIDLISATNVVPGPSSTELAMHLGARRAGPMGLVVAGLAFLAAATVLVWFIAMGYVRYGRRPEVAMVLAGMQPVVLAVVVQAVWRLVRTVLRTRLLAGIAVVGVVAVVAGVHELLVMVGAACAALVLTQPPTNLTTPRAGLAGLFGGRAFDATGAIVLSGAASAAVATTPTLLGVFGAFLKTGSVVFGSGYVLVAFLRGELVLRNQWMSEGQLLDAIAIGQVTPGPLFSSATFVGYLLAGHAGAAVATVGIFLPAFVFVALTAPLVRYVRRSPRASRLLDGMNAGSLALMTAATILVGRSVVTSGVGVGTFLVASAALILTRVSTGWVLLLGAAGGGLVAVWRGAV